MPVVSRTTSERHVAVLAFPIASHPGLLLSLVSRLAVAAPTVTFSFFNTAKSNRSLFSVPTPHNITPYDVSDGIPEGYVFVGKPQEDINLFLAVAEDEFRRALEAAEAETGKEINCLVADAFIWFSSEMAEKRRVPWVPLWTSGASSLSIHFYTDLIRQNVGLNGIEGRKDERLDFIPGFSAVRLGDLPGGVVYGNLESPFSTMLHRMGQCLTKATAIPINSFEEMDPEINKDLNRHFSNFLNIGPFNLISPTPLNNDEFSCISWLDKHQPQSVAYIGFGTVATPPPHELVALAEALEESSTPFLWSINENSKKHLPEGFLERTAENGKVVSWAPQVHVLAHASAGVFITHGGWNSVVESIGAGVPLIMRPFFGEQQLNTWMVENVWRIGVRVKGGVFTRRGTLQALEEVLMLHQNGKKLKEQVVAFKELAHKAVGPSGSSTANFKTLLEIITYEHGVHNQ